MSSSESSLPAADAATTLTAITELVQRAIAAGFLPEDVTIILSGRASAVAWHRGAVVARSTT